MMMMMMMMMMMVWIIPIIKRHFCNYAGSLAGLWFGTAEELQKSHQMPAGKDRFFRGKWTNEINHHSNGLFTRHGSLLSGWWFQPSWKILVNGKEYPIYEMENKKCLKPPASYSLYNYCTHARLMSCHANSSCVSFADQLPRYQKSASSATSISAPSCHESPAMISDVFFSSNQWIHDFEGNSPENHGLYHQVLLLLVSFPSNQSSSYVIVPYLSCLDLQFSYIFMQKKTF